MLLFVSHGYTSPSPRRWSGRRGLLVSGGRARSAGASAWLALLLLIQARVLRCSRDCVGALSWMLDVRGDGACLVQNQLPTARAALRPHYTNISLALRLQLRLLAARKQTSDTTPPLASVSRPLARLARVLRRATQYSSGRDGWRPEASRRAATPGRPASAATRWTEARADAHETTRGSPTPPPKGSTVSYRTPSARGLADVAPRKPTRGARAAPPQSSPPASNEPPCRAPSPRSRATSSRRCSS